MQFLPRESSLSFSQCIAQDSFINSKTHLVPFYPCLHRAFQTLGWLRARGCWGKPNWLSQVLNTDQIQGSEVKIWEKVSVPFFFFFRKKRLKFGVELLLFSILLKHDSESSYNQFTLTKDRNLCKYIFGTQQCPQKQFQSLDLNCADPVDRKMSDSVCYGHAHVLR